MKSYRETYVRKAEIAQLILLHQLYSQPGSRELIFQGGTALRWCYGGYVAFLTMFQSFFTELLKAEVVLP